MSELTLEEALVCAANITGWLAERANQCKISQDDLSALRMLLPRDRTRAEGVAILNESENPEALVALMELHVLKNTDPSIGGADIVSHKDLAGNIHFHAEAWLHRQGGGIDTIRTGLKDTRDESVVDLRDELRARKEGGGDGDVSKKCARDMGLRQCGGWSLPDTLQGIVNVCVALEDAQSENARLREEVAALKANPWAGFTDAELQGIREAYEDAGYPGATISEQVMEQLVRREVRDDG